jgi:hypothetical protein
MHLSKIRSKSFRVNAGLGVLLVLCGLMSPATFSEAAAEAPLPTLPTGEVLKVLSYYSPQQVASVDVTTGVGTVDPTATGFSTLIGAEGAGFELSTQKTWLLDVDCTLWSLNDDGTTTVEFDLSEV